MCFGNGPVKTRRHVIHTSPRHRIPFSYWACFICHRPTASPGSLSRSPPAILLASLEENDLQSQRQSCITQHRHTCIHQPILIWACVWVSHLTVGSLSVLLTRDLFAAKYTLSGRLCWLPLTFECNKRAIRGMHNTVKFWSSVNRILLFCMWGVSWNSMQTNLRHSAPPQMWLHSRHPGTIQEQSLLSGTHSDSGNPCVSQRDPGKFNWGTVVVVTEAVWWL